jgi:hypothetical protein
VLGFTGPTLRWSEGTGRRRDVLEGTVRTVGVAAQTLVEVGTGSEEARAWPWT